MLMSLLILEDIQSNAAKSLGCNLQTGQSPFLIFQATLKTLKKWGFKFNRVKLIQVKVGSTYKVVDFEYLKFEVGIPIS